jgi:signal transduction histidine kinase
MERVTQDWAAEVGVIDLQVFCNDIIDDLQPLLHQRRCAVQLDIERVTVSCDLGALRNIIVNLVQNACVHAYDDLEEGVEPRRIAVTARCSDGPSGVVVTLTVRDWGTGIPPDAWDRIFEPFFTTRRGQGCTGLGLHLAYTAASGALGGSLECRAAEPGIALVCTFPSLELTPDGESIRW